MNRQRIIAFLGGIVLSLSAFAGASAQVHPIDDPNPKPVVHPGLPRVIQTGAPATASPSPLPGTTGTPSMATATLAANQNALGPSLPFAMLRLPMLPVKTQSNSLYNRGNGIHTMSAVVNSMQYSTSANCGSTVGYIFNSGCTISFQMSWCDSLMSGTPCSQDTLVRTHSYQDYYIDATASTASTIGAAYVPNTCCANTSYGPAHTLALNNVGTVALATYDVTAAKWISIVYITVANASGLNSFSDATRVLPQTSFSAGSIAYFSATGYGINNNDNYAVYIESTGTGVTCAAVIPGGTAGAGPCNPTTATQTLKATLNSNGVYAVNAQWTLAGAAGGYSVVVWDLSTG
ncbi:MAG: hypothetical protein JO165_07115, partial [Candidatus Eremiobacteraeota bacterium]|nr:hypothetical protein [Candidatus Eremiobacteraeota bacterium]